MTALPMSSALSLAALDYLDLLKGCLTASLYGESAWQIIEGPPARRQSSTRPHLVLSDAVKRSVVQQACRRSVLLAPRRPFDRAARRGRPGLALFRVTMIGRKRLDNLQYCLGKMMADEVPGDLIETGDSPPGQRPRSDPDHYAAAQC